MSEQKKPYLQAFKPGIGGLFEAAMAEEGHCVIKMFVNRDGKIVIDFGHGRCVEMDADTAECLVEGLSKCVGHVREKPKG